MSFETNLVEFDGKDPNLYDKMHKNFIQDQAMLEITWKNLIMNVV